MKKTKPQFFTNNKKGVIYITETIVSGLIKIGKTKTDNFETRMYHLEHNGYHNVTGLKRRFAIEVDNYEDKESLIHNVFAKSRVAESELFALDINTAIQLLSSFEGKILYPKEEGKNKIFEEATESTKSKQIPNGIYTFAVKQKGAEKQIRAQVKITNGNWTLLQGSQIDQHTSKIKSKNIASLRTKLRLDSSGRLLEDFELGICTPSFAACIVMGRNCNGWKSWKNKNYDFIDIYRNDVAQNEEE